MYLITKVTKMDIHGYLQNSTLQTIPRKNIVALATPLPKITKRNPLYIKYTFTVYAYARIRMSKTQSLRSIFISTPVVLGVWSKSSYDLVTRKIRACISL